MQNSLLNMQNRASKREAFVGLGTSLMEAFVPTNATVSGTIPVFMAALPVPPALVPVEQEEDERAGAEVVPVEPKVFRFC